MKILVACEESQVVTTAMRSLGHEAYSCDIQNCSGGHPEWHIQVDALELIKLRWDMIIAFPPCTYLSCVGARHLFNADHTIKDEERYQKGVEAAEFFRAFLEADCPRVAVENPRQMRCFGLPPADQYIEPYMFGHPWRKKTGLWLRGLPPLIATDLVIPEGLWVGSTNSKKEKRPGYSYILHPDRSAKRRARTFSGVGQAMAEQWAGKIT